MKPVHIRRAEPNDATRIIELIRSTFRPEDLDVTIYGCPGVTDYLARQYAISAELSQVMPWVLEVNGEIAGFLELKRGGSALWLNWIITDSRFRGCGVARKLLSTALTEAEANRRTVLELDVFEHNVEAQNWYAQLGFRRTARSATFALDVPAPVVGPAKTFVSGLAQADACHRAFGFSSFTLSGQNWSCMVGRLGTKWFRITEPQHLGRTEMLETLARLDGSRKLLVVAPDGPAVSSRSGMPLRQLVASIQMEHRAPFEQLI